MKQGEEYIVETKDKTFPKTVFKIVILEVTNTTVYFQIEDSGRKRLFVKDFEKQYWIIEKIEKKLIESVIKILDQEEIGILQSIVSSYLGKTYVSLSEQGEQKLLTIIEKLKIQL
jgi:hypothetical protein